MEFKTRIMELLEQNNIHDCYWDNDLLLVPEYIGADRIFNLMDKNGGFYSYPSVKEVASS